MYDEDVEGLFTHSTLTPGTNCDTTYYELYLLLSEFLVCG